MKILMTCRLCGEDDSSVDGTPEKCVACLTQRVELLTQQRKALAMLAAGTPQFDNPLRAWEAQSLRDNVLAGVL